MEDFWARDLNLSEEDTTDMTELYRNPYRRTSSSLYRGPIPGSTFGAVGRERRASPTELDSIGDAVELTPPEATNQRIRRHLPIIDPNTGRDIFVRHEETPQDFANLESISGDMGPHYENVDRISSDISTNLENADTISVDMSTNMGNDTYNPVQNERTPTESVVEDVKNEIGQVILNKIEQLNTEKAREVEKQKMNIKKAYDEKVNMLEMEHEMKLKAEQDKYKAEINTIEENKSETQRGIEEAIKKLTLTLTKLQEEGSGEVQLNVRKDMECTICFEEMKPPIKIFNCTSGHLICSGCKDKMGGVRCPTCKHQNVAGRNLAMERLARTMYGQQ